MGFFDFLRPRTNDKTKPYTPMDQRKAECPHCGNGLTKVPGSRTKCPHCSQFMYVRTRSKDGARVVVTKAEAEKIEEEWSIVAGTHDQFVADKAEFEQQKEVLRGRFGGREPSDEDVRWGLLNKQGIEHAKNGDWGLYRNTRFEMGEAMRRRMEFKAALKHYLEVCYLDLNGPNNRGGITDSELLEKFPPFTPNKGAFLAPGVIDLIRRIGRKLNLDKTEIKRLFLDVNSQVGTSLSLPLTAETCWQATEQDVYPDVSV
jgi:DNA-directed RNA polymerase subunit M/transcription elongation factor TFIIS